MSRGRIEKALSGFYYVNTGDAVLQCRARGKFRREGLSPLVGDWVQVRELGGGEGFVEAVEPRKNVFLRPSAANIDQLVIIASAAIPVTEPYLIDRIAAIAALKGCRVLLCLNKCDLDTADELYGIYVRSAIQVLRVSAETGEGLDDLCAAIDGKLNAFTGNSGVGKSSILNALAPQQLQTDAARDAERRGQPPGKMSAARSVLRAAELDLRGIVRVAGAGDIHQIFIVAGARIRVADDGRERRAAGPAVLQPA